MSVHILHVEDDPDDVELLQSAFEDIANLPDVKVIREGHKVLPWLEQQSVLPDVIVMDLNLPKMHGKEILAAIKANDHLRDLPVVILTTSSSKEDKNYCLNHGVSTYITKPATVQGFKDAVKMILAAAGTHANKT